MHALVVCLSLALPSFEDWTPLPAPSLTRAAIEALVPPVLWSGSHLELTRGESSATSESASALLPYATFLQIVEEDARAKGARLEVQRFEGGALVRGEKPVIAAARALGESLDLAARALDVDLVVVMKPSKAGADVKPMRFERRVRSGDTTFFGTRETLTFVAGFSVQVAAESGQSEPTIGRAHHGRGLHLTACRVAGGERVFVQGFFDAAEIAEVKDFDPDTADLGVLQQPRVVWTQAEFSGSVDASGTLSLDVRGLPGATPHWVVEIQARTSSDEALAAAPEDVAGFVVFDLAFCSAAQASDERLGALLSGKKRALSSASSPGTIPPSAIASLVEAARGPSPRGGRPSLYWSERLLLVPRADGSAVGEARSLVRGIEAARLGETRVECKLGALAATLSVCAGGRARFVSGSERPLLLEYRLEVAPQIWMPQPISDAVFDGACFELRGGTSSVDVVLSTVESGPVTEITRDSAQIGRLQTFDRRVRSGAARVEAGTSQKIELTGADDGVAVIRCERR